MPKQQRYNLSSALHVINKCVSPQRTSFQPLPLFIHRLSSSCAGLGAGQKCVRFKVVWSNSTQRSAISHGVWRRIFSPVLDTVYTSRYTLLHIYGVTKYNLRSAIDSNRPVSECSVSKRKKLLRRVTRTTDAPVHLPYVCCYRVACLTFDPEAVLWQAHPSY